MELIVQVADLKTLLNTYLYPLTTYLYTLTMLAMDTYPYHIPTLTMLAVDAYLHPLTTYPPSLTMLAVDIHLLYPLTTYPPSLTMLAVEPLDLVLGESGIPLLELD